MADDDELVGGGFGPDADPGKVLAEEKTDESGLAFGGDNFRSCFSLKKCTCRVLSKQ